MALANLKRNPRFTSVRKFRSDPQCKEKTTADAPSPSWRGVATNQQGGHRVQAGPGVGVVDQAAHREVAPESKKDAAGLSAAAAKKASAAKALTPGEQKAYRMGALAAGAEFAAAANTKCGCRSRIENLRIAFAARGVALDAPTHWPQRGGE